MTAAQLELEHILRALPSNRPLVPITSAIIILNREESEVLKMIDDGRINFAFDLAHPTADRRRKIHIHRESVEAAKQSSFRSADSLAALLQRTVPRGAAGNVSIKALSICFNLSETHVTNLAAAGCLRCVSEARTGPGGSALIERTSIIAFLTHRRIK